MNREIKFRFLVEGEMHYMDLVEITAAIEFGNDVWTYCRGQYIGMKDSNGTDIYEGDYFDDPAYPVYFEEGAFFCDGELARDQIHKPVKGNIYQTAP